MGGVEAKCGVISDELDGGYPFGNVFLSDGDVVKWNSLSPHGSQSL